MARPIDELRELLTGMTDGPIEDPEPVLALLMRAWGSLEGGDAEGMTAHKLRGRVELLTWRPPLLVFEIERHGGTVMGSSRAERHRWLVNVRRGTAEWERAGYRQITPNAPRLNVKPIAHEIAAAIISGASDPRFTRRKDGSVYIRISQVIPADSFNQTVSARRRRFTAALIAELEPAGWREVKLHTYMPVHSAAGDG